MLQSIYLIAEKPDTLNIPPLYFPFYQTKFTACLSAHAAVFLSSTHEVGDYIFVWAKG
jgi:hypothetical protein